MLRIDYRACVLLMSAVLVGACSKSGDASGGSAPALARGSRTVTASEPDVPGPYVSFTLRDATDDGRIVQGMPVRVAVALEPPENSATPLEIAPAQGTWADAIHVELRLAAGGNIAIRAAPVGAPEMAGTKLSSDRRVGGLWRFTATQTQGLVPGGYRLAVRLVVPEGRGWTGAVAASEIPVRVTAASDGPNDFSLRSLALAQDALVDERLEEAAGVLDALLLQQHENLRGWLLRGLVAERAGNPFTALTCANRARKIYDSLGADEPHVVIETLYSRVLQGLFETNEAARARQEPPPWSWLSPGLLESMEDERPVAAEVAQVANAPSAATDAPAASRTATPPVAAAAQPAPPPPIPPPGTVLASDAIAEAEILRDARGQWASAAKASSEYRSSDYSAHRATGVPDVGTYSDNPRAWAPSTSERGIEWLELAFAQPTRATEVRVRQSYTPGTIVRVEAFAPDRSSLVLWSGRDTNAYPQGRIAWFLLRFPKTDMAVAQVRLTLNTAAAKGWKEIDAVQLVGE